MQVNIEELEKFSSQCFKEHYRNPPGFFPSSPSQSFDSELKPLHEKIAIVKQAIVSEFSV